MKNLIFRKDKIIELCKNKKVLHLGFIQHAHLYRKLIDENNWLHEKIFAVAESLVGIDYLKDDVDYIKLQYGYELHSCDVTELDKFKYNGKFDVIVCGELIEHLENPGLMLDGIKRLLDKNGILIITTPNPWSKRRMKLIKKNILENEWLNPEHTCWFSFGTLSQLLDRKGYKKVFYDYYLNDSTEKYFYNASTKFHHFRNLIKKLRISFTKKHNYNGLFFVCSLK